MRHESCSITIHMLNLKEVCPVIEDLSKRIEELEGELEDAREVIRLLWGWHEANERSNADTTQFTESVVKYLH